MMRWIERQRYFLDFTLSSLLRRKWKNMSLIGVYGVIIFMVASVLLFTEAIRKEANAILDGAPEMIVQRTLAGRHELIPAAYAAAIGKIRGVQSVSVRLWGYYFHPASQANYTVMVSERPPVQDDQILVGNGVGRTWGTIRARQIYLQTYTGSALVLKIAGTADAATELVSADLILVSPSAFRQLFGVPEGFATDLALRIRNSSEGPVIAQKIIKLFPDTRPILRSEIRRTYASVFDWRSGYVIVLLSGAVLAFFIFAWDKATGLSAGEKAEIAILKAIGWDTGDILLLKFWEGLVICLTAFLLGLGGAYIHVFIAAAPLFEHALKGWATLYPAFRLTPDVSAYQLSVVFALTVLPYTLMTIVPAWRAATTDPDAVMRQA
jgi:ABC-type lipoprotein release transport system permease subunit